MRKGEQEYLNNAAGRIINENNKRFSRIDGESGD